MTSRIGGMERPEAREQEPTTLEELFDLRYAPMVRLAHVLTGSNAAAEDVVQGAFVELHRRWDHVEQPAAYLRTSVVNACRSWHRSRLREQARVARLPRDAAVGPEARELLDALAALPSRQRIALVLRYYEDLSEAEIAAVLQCAPGTVKSSLHRGLARLRKVIEP